MTAAKLPKKILLRQHEITADFLKLIDQHLDELLAGEITEMYEIRDFAARMFIHPTHLSNTIKLTTGKPPCFFVEERIINIAKQELLDTRKSVAEIANMLTFDPSNFTKFFKRFAGCTPKQFREAAYAEKLREASVTAL